MAAFGGLQGGNPTVTKPGASPYINPGMQSPIVPQQPQVGGNQYRTMPAVTQATGPQQGSPVMGGGAQNQVRAMGPTSGFDPSYLQNLATSDAGAFARPQGGLSFNPLSSLTGLPGQGVSGGGNAPVAGIPQGMLTQALAANPTFQQGGVPGQNDLAQMLQSIFGSNAFLGNQSNTPSTGGLGL